jgi:hypothetical protein
VVLVFAALLVAVVLPPALLAVVLTVALLLAFSATPLWELPAPADGATVPSRSCPARAPPRS